MLACTAHSGGQVIQGLSNGGQSRVEIEAFVLYLRRVDIRMRIDPEHTRLWPMPQDTRDRSERYAVIPTEHEGEPILLYGPQYRQCEEHGLGVAMSAPDAGSLTGLVEHCVADLLAGSHDMGGVFGQTSPVIS